MLVWREDWGSPDGEGGSRSGAGLRRDALGSESERLSNLRRRVLFMTSPLALRTSLSKSSSSEGRVDWVDSLKAVVIVGERSVVAPNTRAPRAR